MKQAIDQMVYKDLSCIFLFVFWEGACCREDEIVPQALQLSKFGFPGDVW